MMQLDHTSCLHDVEDGRVDAKKSKVVECLMDNELKKPSKQHMLEQSLNHRESMRLIDIQ
jgi:hypothetical protein